VNCGSVEKRIIPYLYGETNAEEARAIQDHLDACPACQAKVAEFSRLLALVKAQSEPEPSTMVIHRIVAQARDEVQRKQSLWGIGWIRILATLCIMGVVGGLVSYQLGGHLSSRRVSLTQPVDGPVKVSQPSAPAVGGEVRAPGQPSSMLEADKAVLPLKAPDQALSSVPKPEPLIPDDRETAPAPPAASSQVPKQVPEIRAEKSLSAGYQSTDALPPVKQAQTRPAQVKPPGAEGAVEKKVLPRTTPNGATMTTRTMVRSSGESNSTAWHAEAWVVIQERGSVSTSRKATDGTRHRSEGKMDQGQSETLVLMGRSMVKAEPEKAGQPEETVKAMDRAVSSPITVSELLDKARASLDAGQHQVAVKQFSGVLRRLPAGHPDRPKALLGLAQAYEGLGNYEKSMSAYRALAQISPAHQEIANQKLEELSRK